MAKTRLGLGPGLGVGAVGQDRAASRLGSGTPRRHFEHARPGLTRVPGKLRRNLQQTPSPKTGITRDQMAVGRAVAQPKIFLGWATAGRDARFPTQALSFGRGWLRPNQSTVFWLGHDPTNSFMVLGHGWMRPSMTVRAPLIKKRMHRCGSEFRKKLLLCAC